MTAACLDPTLPGAPVQAVRSRGGRSVFHCWYFRPLQLAVLLCLAASASAQSAAPAPSLDVQIGIQGQYRVGQWTGVRIDGSDQQSDSLRLQTIDGDGVEVVYADAGVDDAGRSPDSRASQWRYLIPGLASAPLTILSADESEASNGAEVLRRLRFPDEAIAPDRPWLLVLGDPLGLDEIGRNELLNRAALATTTVVRDPEALPDHWLGFEGVDALVINATASEQLARIDDLRTEALLHWVRRGGQVLVTLGPAGPEALRESRLLRELIGYTEEPLAVDFEPTAVEAFTSSRNPLTPFRGTLLPTEQGQPLLIGRTVTRRPAPIAVRYRYGFGEVVAIAADLDAEPFADWPQRTELVDALAPQVVPGEREQRDAAPRSSEIAYTDMAGQVRATLDRFAHSRTMPFSLAALILMGLFVLIGPVDYFLVNRWLGRPLLGWLTFPLGILLLSGVLIAWARNVDEAMSVNRLEVVDLDPRIGWGQAFTWSHAFSSQAGRWDVDGRLQAGLAEGDAVPLLLAPYGYAGPMFGGVQITDQRLPPYEVLVSRHDGTVSSQLRNMPLAPVSSKGLAGWAQFSTSLEPTDGLVSFRGAELRGSLTNPLPVDLLDGLLLYDDWVYLLPTRLPAGATIDSMASLRQKTFRWHLTRRKALESNTESEPWNPGEDEDLGRLGEILSFYNVAGGIDYTTLTNHPLRRLDLSPSLDTSQAILVGRLEQPAVSLDLRRAAKETGDAEESVQRNDQTISIVRVMLPVAEEETNR